MTPLEAAVLHGNIEMVRLFIERGADPNDPRALARAVLRDEELVHLLLEEFEKRYPYGKKFDGSQALKHAIERGNISMIEAIWRRADTTSLAGGDWNYEEDNFASPLVWAIRKNQGTSLIEAQTLLGLGADPNGIISYHGSLTALGEAIATESLPIVQLLLEYGANINPPTTTSPLQAAIKVGKYDIVRLLLDRGADINPPAIKGARRTPLQSAVKRGDYDMAQLLLNRGADVNAAATRNGGATALQFAAIKGYVGIAMLLLKAGADVNAPPAKCDGRTALEGAAEWGRTDMVKLLLEAGVEVEGRGWWYFRHAIKLAENNRHYTTLEILMSYQRSTMEPVRPKAVFADCEGWTFWTLETEDGFEPWEGDLPAYLEALETDDGLEPWGEDFSDDSGE